MGYPFAPGRLTRVLGIAASAALASGAAFPAAASELPARAAATSAKAAHPAKPTRYCIKRNQAGAGAVERYCKSRERWIRENRFDPARPE